MKNVFWMILLFVLSFTACQAVATPTLTPVSTRTVEVLATTTNPVPSPTLPVHLPGVTPSATRTPTAQAVISGLLATPGPVICPEESAEVVANFPQDAIVERDALLAYLNAGGSLKLFEENPRLLGQGSVLDLTGDVIKEIILETPDRYDFFTCNDGKYQLQAFHFAMEHSTQLNLKDVIDLNQNGVPELIFSAARTRNYSVIYIYEWDGGITYRSLIRLQRATIDHDDLSDWDENYVSAAFWRDLFNISKTSDWVDTASGYVIKDTNGDGLKEIVVVDDLASHRSKEPFGHRPVLDETITLGWNGKNYVNLAPGNFSPPKYRFQATLLGDLHVLYRNYPKALAFYQQAISDTKLLPWTEERRSYEWQVLEQMGTAIPTPPPDLDNQASLAAYAYFRMMILYENLGDMKAMKLNYEALQRKFPDGAGYFYAELAKVFWDSYQHSTHIYYACSYIENDIGQNYSNLLGSLGNKYEYGWPTHQYTPNDICPSHDLSH